MYRCINILLWLLTVSLSSNALALDNQEQATQAYYALKEALNSVAVAATEIRPKTTSAVILEGYSVNGSVGTTTTVSSTLPGPISSSAIRSISQTLYEEPGYGLYFYQGYKIQVWYVGDLASVIILMNNSNSGTNPSPCTNCKR